MASVSSTGSPAPSPPPSPRATRGPIVRKLLSRELVVARSTWYEEDGDDYHTIIVVVNHTPDIDATAEAIDVTWAEIAAELDAHEGLTRHWNNLSIRLTIPPQVLFQGMLRRWFGNESDGAICLNVCQKRFEYHVATTIIGTEKYLDMNKANKWMLYDLCDRLIALFRSV
eukprot:TRINITY_DN466_c0_g1_i2.p1 TRINITY_DN466_c0_g1~~TRINITY_DN466_c0_g1_i2.p1  ORF type:complete len:170 (+),score=7.35 TRINITY_DN466_c0_g1_i2:310-819(+)